MENGVLSAAVAEYEEIAGKGLILDAARNVVSPSVRVLLASALSESDLSGRVETYGIAYGAAPIHIIEQFTRSLVQRLFGTPYAELRALSGSLANGLGAVAVTEPGDGVLMPPEWAFGHKSLGRHGYPGISGRRIIDMPWDSSSMGPDLDGLRDVIKRERPRLVTLGLSRHLFPEPIREVADLAKEVDARLLYDGAHVLGLIAGGAFPNPLALGFDLLTGSTYKTLPGPHGGIVLCRDSATLDSVAKLCDGWVSAYGNNRVAALAQALVEMEAAGSVYARRVVDNARALGGALAAAGFAVVGADKGFTATHQVLVDVTNLGDPANTSRRLSLANLIVKPPTRVDRRLRDGRADGWWLRLGTSAVTRLGMSKDEMYIVADVLAGVLLRGEDSSAVAGTIRDLVSQFETIRYLVSTA